METAEGEIQKRKKGEEALLIEYTRIVPLVEGWNGGEVHLVVIVSLGLTRLYEPRSTCIFSPTDGFIV